MKELKETKNVKEKITNVMNKVKEIKNPNELARNRQNKTVYWVIAGLGAFIFTGWFFMYSRGDTVKKSDTKQETAQMASTVDPQFNQESSSKALDKQQQEIKNLNEKLAEISEQMDFLQKSSDEKNQEEINDNKVAVQELQTKIAELEVALKKSGSRLPANSELEAKTAMESSTRGITTTSFSFFSSENENQATPITGALKNAALGSNTIKPKTAKNAKDYVPPGTFAKAVLLSGADTNAGVHGQTDTTPIVMRILDNGTLPNGSHSSLKGCFVTAAAYGDASSERGQIRLQHLSCIRPGNHILDVPVEGTINDMGGNDGIRGHVVMRNQKLIWNAGVSGFLSGIGNAMQQSTTTQSISPLGVTSAIKTGKVFEHSVYGGANTALGKLADYYIKLADMYHPIVQVHAGSQVNIVFLKGFSLTEGIPEQTASEKDTTTEITSSQEVSNPDYTQAIKNAHLGQTVTEQKKQNNINEEVQ